MANILYIFGTILKITAGFMVLYHFIISIFAFIPKKKEKILNNKLNSFLIIVPAHNEENVIFDMVKSIFSQNYDKNYFDVYVVCDNCNDNTEKLAKSAGAKVLIRENKNQKGKGYAVKFALNKIEKEYNGVCVIDADNIISTSFLEKINESFNMGYDSVQGYIDAKNPYDSWVSASYYITLLCVNKMYQLARHNLGFPVQLNGTGFAIKHSILKNLDWDESCLTDDIEITIKMAENGIFTSYQKDAVVYDEKPTSLLVSIKQRIRWMQGESDALFKHFIPLLKSKKISALKSFDMLIYLMQPILFVITGILSLFKASSFEATILLQLLYVPFVLLTERKLNLKTMLYYIPYLVFMYTWPFVSLVGIIKHKNKNWFHTEHSRKGSYENGKEVRLS